MSRAEIALRGAAALLLVCLAVLLGLAARDVLAWRGQTARANVAVARFSRDPGIWEPGTVLPVAVSRSLLRMGDGVRFGRALQQLQLLRGRNLCAGSASNVFNFNRPTPCATNFDPPRVELAKLELTFDNIARASSRAAVRSRAQELHTLLLLQQLLLTGSSFGTGVDQAFQQAISGMQQALRTDPTNTEAQYDLEALLDAYRPIAVELASQLALHRGEHGDTGAAGGSPGSGAVGAGGF